ncbi:MAG: hypothetical protein ACREE0_21175 [Phenylobacterium sp.]
MAKLATIALAALASLVASHAGAADGWLRDGSPLKKQPNTATSGGFAVMQFATNQPDRVMGDWEKPGASVTLSMATQTPRNSPLVTFVLFRGCRADAKGNCNVTADYETTSPSGKRYDQTRGAEIWVGRRPPPERALQLSASAYGLVFEDKDAAGTYLVRATITDHVSGATLHTEQKLTVVGK